jgi:hypothetical protein
MQPELTQLGTEIDMATSSHVHGSVGQGPAVTGGRGLRRRERLKMSLPLEVRPFDARFSDVRDVGEVIDFTRDGLFFTSCMPHYFVGMRVLVTFPFGEKISAHKKFLGSVVRVEERSNSSVGVAVKFVL